MTCTPCVLLTLFMANKSSVIFSLRLLKSAVYPNFKANLINDDTCVIKHVKAESYSFTKFDINQGSINNLFYIKID